MNIHNKLLLAAALALPLGAIAQTTPTVKPADQPRTELEKDQTTKNGDAPKYGGPGTDVGGTPAKDTTRSTKTTNKKLDKSKEGAPTGGLTTYPAPTRDGTPTSPSTTK